MDPALVLQCDHTLSRTPSIPQIYFYPRPQLDAMTGIIAPFSMRKRSSESSDVVEKILSGERELIASFHGRSQYSATGGGVSACGLAALNCARVILGKEKNGLRGTAIIQYMMGRETLEVSLELTSITLMGSPSSSLILGCFTGMLAMDNFCTPRCR